MIRAVDGLSEPHLDSLSDYGLSSAKTFSDVAHGSIFRHFSSPLGEMSALAMALNANLPTQTDQINRIKKLADEFSYGLKNIRNMARDIETASKTAHHSFCFFDQSKTSLADIAKRIGQESFLNSVQESYNHSSIMSDSISVLMKSDAQTDIITATLNELSGASLDAIKSFKRDFELSRLQDQFNQPTPANLLSSVKERLSGLPSCDGQHSSLSRLMDLVEGGCQTHRVNSILDDALNDKYFRSDFVNFRSLDPWSTDFPTPKFQYCKSPSLLGPHRLMADGDQTSELNCWAYKEINNFENLLRRFIDQVMTAKYGSDWPKYWLPNGLYSLWEQNKFRRLKSGGIELPLIYYADFTDYEKIICRRDHWRELFAPFFKRLESVRESFQRLYPIRVDVMHSRPIKRDDELVLSVEVRLLSKLLKL